MVESLGENGDNINFSSSFRMCIASHIYGHMHTYTQRDEQLFIDFLNGAAIICFIPVASVEFDLIIQLFVLLLLPLGDIFLRATISSFWMRGVIVENLEFERLHL